MATLVFLVLSRNVYSLTDKSFSLVFLLGLLVFGFFVLSFALSSTKHPEPKHAGGPQKGAIQAQ
jgi:hypothetical protein